MGFKINYKGLEVVCDTVDEVDELAERHNRRGATAQTSTNGKSSSAGTLFDSDAELKPDLKSVIGSFSVNSKKLIGVLVDAGAPLSDDIIAEQMRAQKTSIAGYISDIALKSQKVGYDYTKFFTRRQISDKQGEREYSTEIPPTMLYEVSQALMN